MLSITIKINETELYEVEAYLQPGGDLQGICTYKIISNGYEVGVCRHDRSDGAWALALRVLDSFSAPAKTLQEGGAHTALRRIQEEAPLITREAFVRAVPGLAGHMLREEAAASVRLDGETHIVGSPLQPAPPSGAAYTPDQP